VDGQSDSDEWYQRIVFRKYERGLRHVAETNRFRAEIEDFAGTIPENLSFMVDVEESIRNLKIIKETLVKAGLAQ
jgi:hypothetical protein